MKLNYWWMKGGGTILMLENDNESERLKKALINAYKALERKYLENLEEIEKISSKLGNLS